MQLPVYSSLQCRLYCVCLKCLVFFLLFLCAPRNDLTEKPLLSVGRRGVLVMFIILKNRLIFFSTDVLEMLSEWLR